MKFVRFFDPKTEIDFTKRFRPALIVATVFPILVLLALFIFGINWGIDFLGGTELQVKFDKPVSAAEIRHALDRIGIQKSQVQQYGPLENNEMLIRVERTLSLQSEDIERMKQLVQKSNLSEGKPDIIRVVHEENMGNRITIWLPKPNIEGGVDSIGFKEASLKQKADLAGLLDKESGLKLRRSMKAAGSQAEYLDAVMPGDPVDNTLPYTVDFEGVSDKIQKALQVQFGDVQIRRVEFVDSQVSKQLRTHGALAIFYALLAIVIYVAIRFDLFFAPGAILALINDCFGAMLVFLIGRLDFDSPSIAALLTILGYSINNTIVIYDRIRETLPAQSAKKQIDDNDLKHFLNKAINDTLSRTINTTLTVLIASISLWIFSSGPIQTFAMVLTVGVIFGAFSSVFVSPAAYLFAKRFFRGSTTDTMVSTDAKGPTREDKARGVV